MYQAIHHSLDKEFVREDLQGPLERTNLPGDACLLLTSDPKPRLRWTAELHERFVDAVTQLGGPDKATPKTIMRTMGLKGITLYHLKSHLQKYRMGKQSSKELNDGSKDVVGLPESQGTCSDRMVSQEMYDGYQVTEALRVQMEVQRRLHEQLEVQKHLQIRMEAQGKYLQSILEKACKVLADHNAASTGLESARRELSELTIKVSNDCFDTPRDAPNFASLSEIPSVCLDEKPINRQAQNMYCSINSCLTSLESSGRESTIDLQVGGKKRTRAVFCSFVTTVLCFGRTMLAKMFSGSLVSESGAGLAKLLFHGVWLSCSYYKVRCVVYIT